MLVVLGCQVRLQAVNTAQVDLSTGYHGEQDREAARCARGTDALAGRGLRHVITPHEKIEKRRMSPSGPQFPAIDDVDVPEQAGDVVLVLSYQLIELTEERLVAQSFQSWVRKLGWRGRGHTHLYHEIFRHSSDREAPERHTCRLQALADRVAQFREKFGKKFVIARPEASARHSWASKSRQAQSLTEYSLLDRKADLPTPRSLPPTFVI
ncbi:MAG TPA: hypothetical protein VI197_35135 [Polyangiaceae bacterium]